MPIVLQDILTAAEAASNAPFIAQCDALEVQVATQATALAAKDTQLSAQTATISGLQAELATFHPVPDAHNTGFRGGLTAAGAGTLTAAANAVIENKQLSYPTAFSGANVTLKNDRVYVLSSGVLDGSAATGFVMVDTVIVGSYKGSGTFIKSTANSLELTAASVVTDCYFPGGITGAGKAASTITNTTVTP